jgi:hypothetical protein
MGLQYLRDRQVSQWIENDALYYHATQDATAFGRGRRCGNA